MMSRMEVVGRDHSMLESLLSNEREWEACILVPLDRLSINNRYLVIGLDGSSIFCSRSIVTTHRS